MYSWRKNMVFALAREHNTLFLWSLWVRCAARCIQIVQNLAKTAGIHNYNAGSMAVLIQAIEIIERTRQAGLKPGKNTERRWGGCSVCRLGG